MRRSRADTLRYTLEVRVDGCVPGERDAPGSAPRRAARRPRAVSSTSVCSAAVERVGVAGRDRAARRRRRPPRARSRGGHERRAARERFERGQSEALFERRVRDRRGLAEQRGNDVVVDVAGPDHVGGDAARGDRVAHGGRAPAVAAGDARGAGRDACAPTARRRRRASGCPCGVRSCRRTRRTAAAMPCAASSARSVACIGIRAEAVVVDTVPRDVDAAARWSDAPRGGRRCTRETHTIAAARRALARIMRRKYATLCARATRDGRRTSGRAP